MATPLVPGRSPTGFTPIGNQLEKDESNADWAYWPNAVVTHATPIISAVVATRTNVSDADAVSLTNAVCNALETYLRTEPTP